jgi:hypothetical protein
LSHETWFSDVERRDKYVFLHLDVAPSDAFTTNFVFVNLIEHKAEEIIGFYGSREHKGWCQSLVRKRPLNCVFEAMDICYADQLGPSTSLSAKDAASLGRGRGARGRRGRAQKMMAGHGTSTAVMDKRKLSDRGCGPMEPVDVRIGKEIASRVGNSKMVMI